jgi:hypothetical protein
MDKVTPTSSVLLALLVIPTLIWSVVTGVMEDLEMLAMVTIQVSTVVTMVGTIYKESTPVVRSKVLQEILAVVIATLPKIRGE